MQRRLRPRRLGLARHFSIALRQTLPIRAEIAHQGLEEGAASCRIQLLVDVEHLARHGSARCLAPAGQ